MSGWKVPEYSTVVLCIYPRPLSQVGKSQCIEVGFFVYIPGFMSVGKVPEYRTEVIGIYLEFYVRWEGPSV